MRIVKNENSYNFKKIKFMIKFGLIISRSFVYSSIKTIIVSKNSLFKIRSALWLFKKVKNHHQEEI